MNKSVKAGILIAILAVPALAFLVLQFFGKNQFDIPYYFPKENEQGDIIIEHGDTLFSVLEPFQLINQNGEELSLPDGKIGIYNFFFSRCGTICPIMNSHLAKVADLFKDEDLIHFYGITVDPANDTPEVLKSYAKSMELDGLNYDLLTGDKAYIYNLCIKGFRLPVADASEYDPEVNDVDEMFIHSDKVMLIDSKGHFRGIYSGTNSEEIDRLTVEAKILLGQMKSK